ncbi:MAG TPA: 2'-deoxycytidine 5'-triphosphate deaminase [Bradyrhizobium sp.]|nr:2'-deoxycytidine 5'-triphosphate deaminase [Bradyrhizobium sp.]
MTSKSTNAFGDLLAPANPPDKSEASQAHAGETGRGLEPEAHSTGILPSQELEHLIRVSKDIAALEPNQDDQIQPASLDLRLGSFAYRVRASFLPGRNSTVQEKLEQFAMHKMDIANGGVLERGCVYIVPLMESVALRKRMWAMGNPKSSTGRLDVFTRLISVG